MAFLNNRVYTLNMNTLEWIVLIGAAAGTISVFIVNLFKLFRTWFTFINDWNGDGTSENPGIVKRLQIGDERFDKIDAEISVIKAELFTNGGSSLRDSVNRIEAAVTKKPKKAKSQ